MLRRLLSRKLHLHLQLGHPLLPPPTPFAGSSFPPIDTLQFHSLRVFSTSGRDGSDDPNDPWKISPESEEPESSLFSSISKAGEEDPFGSDPSDEAKGSDGSDAWGHESTAESKDDVFASIEKGEHKAGIQTMDDWEAAGGLKPWTIGEDEEKEDLFQSIERVEVGLTETGGAEGIEVEGKKEEELDMEELKRKEKELMKTLKGTTSY